MIVCIILLLVGSFCIYYFSRFRTLSSIQKVTSYEDGYNLYQIDIKYDYDLDQIIDYGITDNQSMIDAIIKEALPLLPVKIKAPDFGCTAFTMTDNQKQVHMGRNYDFKLDTSAMLVYCTPKNGYKSVAFAALDNISANTPDESMKKKLATLTSPFICLDGMNEKVFLLQYLLWTANQFSRIPASQQSQQHWLFASCWTVLPPHRKQ